MGYSIIIGKVCFDTSKMIKGINDDEDSHMVNYKIEVMPCEGKEPEGVTSDQWTIDHGHPNRSPSYTVWSQFMNSCNETRKISEIIRPNGSDGFVYLLNTPAIISCIGDLEKQLHNLSEDNKDRAKWLCFWVKEAIKRYGNDAAIGFW